MTKKLTIEFLQFNKPKRNGDRATTLTDCYDFEIKLNGLLLQTFSQYLPWYESVSSYDAALRVATKYAEDLADMLGLKRPELVTMIEKETKEVKWVPESSLFMTTDMIRYKDWYHITISAIRYGRYITRWDSDLWCGANCEGKYSRGFYRELDGLYEAVYFESEEDRVKFILWL